MLNDVDVDLLDYMEFDGLNGDIYLTISENFSDCTLTILFHDNKYHEMTRIIDMLRLNHLDWKFEYGGITTRIKFFDNKDMWEWVDRYTSYLHDISK